MIKKIKVFLKVLLVLILAIALFVGLSIPIARLSERHVTNPGVAFTKIVFRHATIIPLDSSYVLNNHTLFIDNSKIVAVLPDSLANTAGYTEIDASGKYILPGLVDMHAHIFDRSDLTNYLAFGVTHVRNMMGFPMHLRWKSQWLNGDFPGSKMITASPTLNAGDGADPFHKLFREGEEVSAVLKRYKEEGYDFFKIYDGITADQFSVIMQTAEDLNMSVAGHPPIAVPREVLLQSDLHSFEHIEEVYNGYLDRKKDDSLAHVIARQFAASKLPICVTLSAYHHIYLASNHKEEFLKQTPYEQINPLLIFIGNRLLSDYLEPSEELRLAIAAKRAYLSKLTKLFYEEGVLLIFGTDTGPNLTAPGLTVHEELQLLHEAGIPRFNILKSATVDAMRLIDSKDELRGVTSGAEAHLLLVQDNPLEDLTILKNPVSVVSGGVFYDSLAIQKLKVMGKTKSGWYVSMGNLLQQFFNK